jgi:hypothetical protein
VHQRSCFKAEMFEQCTNGKFAEGEIKQDGGIKEEESPRDIEVTLLLLVNLFQCSGQLSRHTTKIIAS